jgi:hypothetical protein
MKAISIKQPYASLIAEGKKTIETRKWQTKYRGDILICASKKRDMAAMFYLNNSGAKLAFSIKGDLLDSPVGSALCIAELYDIKPMVEEDRRKALCGVYEGAYSWFLRNIRPIEPFEVKGALSLFEVPDELLKERNK